MRVAVYSMTGYAQAFASPREPAAEVLHKEGSAAAVPERRAGAISVEMRSVNNRFLDVSMRLPDEWRALEPQLRDLITARFKRGKIEVRVSSSEAAGAPAAAAPSPIELAALARLESAVREQLPDARPLSVQEVMAWCRDRTPVDAASPAVLDAAIRCAESLGDARRREGERLAAFLADRVAELRRLAQSAAPLVPAAVARQQQRFFERWTEALASTATAASTVSQEAARERALSEAAAYALRVDIAEEISRLGSHLDEAARLIDRGGEIGKRFEFLIQELLREANTLGSKAASIELTAISVEMKVAIEQLREQVQNVE